MRRPATFLPATFLPAAIFLTALALGAGPAAAQDSAAAVVQQIHDGAYGSCMKAGTLGSGAALQENCSCSADVAINLLSDAFKQAIADGTQASFTGQKLKGDELERNVTLLKTCPKIGVYLQQQCAGDAGNPHCQVLDRALQQVQ